MAAKKKTTRPSLIPVPRVLGGPIGFLIKSKSGRSVLFSLLMIAGFGLTIYFCWQQVSGKVLASSEYRVDLEDIAISSPPSWIHTDVRKDVFDDLSVEGPISIMDHNVTKRFTDAFTLHPWVEEVILVSKRFPAKVEVQLAYRQPACVVGASGQWFPVDAKGYVLPWQDLSRSDLESLPKVVGINTLPVISVGAYWNDKQVDAAARIGAALQPVWEDLHLDTIQPARTQFASGQKEVASFELTTTGGTVIIWGESPAPKTSSDQGKGIASNKEKAARLKRYFEQNGTLDVPGRQILDLRVTPAEIANSF